MKATLVLSGSSSAVGDTFSKKQYLCIYTYIHPGDTHIFPIGIQSLLKPLRGTFARRDLAEKC